MIVAGVILEDCLRADLYGLLGSLLSVPPGARRLARRRRLEGDSTALGDALADLAQAAKRMDARRVEEEYDALFVGDGTSEVVPLGSRYRDGLSLTIPLGALRGDMARLGAPRAPGIAETEDHIASLLETMRGLIEGAFGPPAGLPAQFAFFRTYMMPWAGRFFDDLSAAPSADFYRAIGVVGGRFMTLEAMLLRISG
ncbi:MAG: molecular chaperone TorD [Telmatospirillum sp.]|nr:molecular chaperone TorD [Telmatospirillum sp.]